MKNIMKHLKSCNALVMLMLLISVAVYAQDSRDVRCTFKYNIEWGEGTKKMNLKIAVPYSIENRQEILKLAFSVIPDTMYEIDGNRYAEYTFTKKPDDMLLMVAYARLYRADYDNIPKEKTLEPLSPEELTRYLQSERFIEVNDEDIQKKAANLKDKTQIKTVSNICKFVHNSVKYKVLNQLIGAVETLKTLKGDCKEYSYLFTAFCRADSIPARTVKGLTLYWPKNYKGFHAWVEVYLDGIGWIPVDPTHNADFKTFDNKYLFLAQPIIDNVLGSGAVCTWRYWGDRGFVRVTPVMYIDDIKIKVE